MGWVPRWAPAATAIALILVLSGSIAVAASSDAVPGDTLYGVKTAAENVRLKLTFSEEAKADLEAGLAQRRVQEMAQLAQSGDTERIQALGSRFRTHLISVEERASRIDAAGESDNPPVVGLKETLRANMARDLGLLNKAEERAPQQARASIAAARFRLMERYERAIAALDRLDD